MRGRCRAGLREAQEQQLVNILTTFPVYSLRRTTLNTPVGLFCRRRSRRDLRRKGLWPWDWTETHIQGQTHMTWEEHDINVGFSHTINGAMSSRMWKTLAASAIKKRRSIQVQKCTLVFKHLNTCFVNFLMGKISCERIRRIQQREDPGIMRFIETLQLVKVLHKRLEGLYVGVCSSEQKESSQLQNAGGHSDALFSFAGHEEECLYPTPPPDIHEEMNSDHTASYFFASSANISHPPPPSTHEYMMPESPDQPLSPCSLNECSVVQTNEYLSTFCK